MQESSPNGKRQPVATRNFQLYGLDDGLCALVLGCLQNWFAKKNLQSQFTNLTKKLVYTRWQARELVINDLKQAASKAQFSIRYLHFETTAQSEKTDVTVGKYHNLLYESKRWFPRFFDLRFSPSAANMFDMVYQAWVLAMSTGVWMLTKLYVCLLNSRIH